MVPVQKSEGDGVMWKRYEMSSLILVISLLLALQHMATWQFHKSDWQGMEEEVSLCLVRCCGTHYH